MPPPLHEEWKDNTLPSQSPRPCPNPLQTEEDKLTNYIPCPSEMPRSILRCNLHGSEPRNLNQDFSQEEEKGSEPVELPNIIRNNQDHIQNQAVPQDTPPQLPCHSRRIRQPPQRFMESEHSTLSTLHLTSRKVQFGQLNNAFLNYLDWKEEYTP